MMKLITAVAMLSLLGACSSDEAAVLEKEPAGTAMASAAGAPTTAVPVAATATSTTSATADPSTSAVAEVFAETTTTVAALTVAAVVDGDTVQLSTGEQVRMIGIDAPEAGVCGSDWATIRLSELVLGRTVVVEPGTRDDVDLYGRMLRFVDVDGVDAGLTLIREGWAVARYDSRDGYGDHTRENQYVQASTDAEPVRNAGPCAVPPTTVPPATAAIPRPLAAPVDSEPAPTITTPQRNASYANCAAVRAAGAAPIRAGEPGYSRKLDRDGDGVGCE